MFADRLSLSSGGRGSEVLIIKSHYWGGRTCLTHPIRDFSRRRYYVLLLSNGRVLGIELAGWGMQHMIGNKREVLVNFSWSERVVLQHLKQKQHRSFVKGSSGFPLRLFWNSKWQFLTHFFHSFLLESAMILADALALKICYGIEFSKFWWRLNIFYEMLFKWTFWIEFPDTTERERRNGYPETINLSGKKKRKRLPNL